MLDSLNLFPDSAIHPEDLLQEHALSKPTFAFLVWKRAFDVLGGLILLVIMSVMAIVLLAVNWRLNPGPLFYVQTRMGQDCKPFRAIKFRTMICAAQIGRGAFDALEHDRITPFGRILRRVRIDELPQVLNVLRGDMSLIGPRPDYYDHALVYLDMVHGYRERHRMRPGISGYAQVRLGYIEGIEGVRAKVASDLQYIAKADLWIDLKILWATIKVVLGRKGM